VGLFSITYRKYEKLGAKGAGPLPESVIDTHDNK